MDGRVPERAAGDAVLPFCFVGLPRRRRTVLPALVVILIASPMFMQNVTFVWTKSFCRVLRAAGSLFYVRGWMKRDSTRLVAGFVLMTADALCIFYVAPWLAVMAVHYVLAVWARRANRGRELAAIVLLCGALLVFIWYGWAIQHFGITAHSNPSDRAVSGAFVTSIF